MSDQLFDIEVVDGRSILRAYRGHQKKVVIPFSVSEIGIAAFRRNMDLEEITFSENLIRIDQEAFNGCMNLKKITFSEGLEMILERAFWGCSALRKAVFPKSLEYIGVRAFECCTLLRSVQMKSENTSVDEYAFRDTRYFELQMEKANTLHRSSGFSQDITDLDLPEGVVNIDLWEYARSDIQTLVLPNSLRTVGVSAFMDCKDLRTVVMSPNTYCNYNDTYRPRAGEGIFAGCTSLEKITFRGRLKNFVWSDAELPELLHGFHREYTFRNCPKLRYMVAWEIPISDFPDEWKPYAVNAYLDDLEREEHYSPVIRGNYDAYLLSKKESLIHRAFSSMTRGMIDYLLDYKIPKAEDLTMLIHAAQEQEMAECTAALLEYQAALMHKNSYLEQFSL